MISPETGDHIALHYHRLATKYLKTLLQVADMLACFLLMLRKGFPGLSIEGFLRQNRQHLVQFPLNVIHRAETVKKEVSRTLYRHCSCSFLNKGRNNSRDTSPSPGTLHSTNHKHER